MVRLLDILGGELAALHQSQSDRLEQTVAAEDDGRGRLVRQCQTWYLQSARRSRERRCAIRDGDRLDIRNRSQPIEGLTIEAETVRHRRILVWRKGDARDEQIPGVESQVHVHELYERPHQEPGSEQEDDRERDLRDHESAPHPRLPPAGRSASCDVGSGNRSRRAL